MRLDATKMKIGRYLFARHAITLVGLGISAVLTMAGIVLARHWMRRLEQRAQAAYPDPIPRRPAPGAGRADTRLQRR